MKSLTMGVSDVIVTTTTEGARQATKYVSPKLIVRATTVQRSRHTVRVLLSIGRPNYRERQFIKLCKKAGELFPIKKTQVKWYLVEQGAVGRGLSLEQERKERKRK